VKAALPIVTDQAADTAAPSLASGPGRAVNPRLIHLFHCDFTPEELSALRIGLAHVPGSEAGRAQLWEQFKSNDAGVFFMRCGSESLRPYEIAFFVFFSVRVHNKTSARELVVRATRAIRPGLPNYMDAALPQIERFAAMLQCQSMTVATPRPGLVAELTKRGWALAAPDADENGEWSLVKRLGADFSNF